jgi:hypothetical protein
MDGSHFDTLVKTLATTRITRLTALRGLAVGALAAAIGSADPDDAAAKGRKCGQCKKSQCHPKNGKKRCRCKKKANGTSCSIAGVPSAICSFGSCVASATPVPPGPPPPAEIPATCRDGVKNGSESDVDCGGPDCPRCTTGKRCNSRADCTTAFCLNNVCTACEASMTSAGTQCGPGCSCPAGACTVNPAPIQATLCADCPPFSFCQDDPSPGVFCFPLCGSV